MLSLFSLFALNLVAVAQQQQPEPLQLSENKTTSLVFPFAIKSVDRGSADVLVQVPRETQNVLQLKAARRNFPVTNLTVITSGGHLYSFPVVYAPHPARTVLHLPDAPPDLLPVQLTGMPLSEASLQVISRHLEGDQRRHYGIRDKNSGLKATLEGIYTYQDLLFCRIVLTNKSALPYSPGLVQGHIRDRRHLKRIAYQQQEIRPVHVHGPDAESLPEGASHVLMVTMPKTSLSSRKLLVLSLSEQQGDRHLELQVRGRHIRQAVPLQLDRLF
ncbi:DUF4138 domain-containing protein [Pontibacter sp. Tf4]|uniref:DUF4138 domain-containing protein n=1 Tax=Pontibacter sp. Tf4 TaxID=2761620 RepID=UPI00351B6E39